MDRDVLLHSVDLPAPNGCVCSDRTPLCFCLSRSSPPLNQIRAASCTEEQVQTWFWFQHWFCFRALELVPVQVEPKFLSVTNRGRCFTHRTLRSLILIRQINILRPVGEQEKKTKPFLSGSGWNPTFHFPNQFRSHFWSIYFGSTCAGRVKVQEHAAWPV